MPDDNTTKAPTGASRSNDDQRSRLWALAECCYILDELPSAKDRHAVIDALSTMGSLSKAMLRGAGDGEAQP